MPDGYKNPNALIKDFVSLNLIAFGFEGENAIRLIHGWLSLSKEIERTPERIVTSIPKKLLSIKLGNITYYISRFQPLN